ncbi:relaxase/mobilization nuclease domain-containing protein [uncultured Olsenella sp.]|uniref:relaxase/mobilization nuclease domain-containing protein n=1 Tax=uncultured Olsenella sp. TaxID=190764 RepID=UPI0026DAD4B7|nr:relaxase/mobilization nuclease domain-containing protein [uncultured Olsenella sp.]
MPLLKPISGHTSCRGVYRYLTKNERALASDYLNLDAPEQENAAFNWAAAMDDTRSRWRNDTPWGDRPCRTYKHYVLSPDPKDHVNLDALRELTIAWAREHFGDFEVAIVYHDDNAGHIPHAHVVVNNTNIVTGRRLQDPDPKELKHSLQRMAKERGFSDFDSAEEKASVRGRVRPRTLQAEHVRRAEREIAEKGGYSWVADIRARIRVARSVTRSEDEFRGLLKSLGVGVEGNSAKARRRDWVFSLAGHPTWRVSGESLGLGYGRESLMRGFSLGAAGHLADAGERRVAELARPAVELDDLSELERLSEALAWLKGNRIRTAADLAAKGTGNPEMTAYVLGLDILKEGGTERAPCAEAGEAFLPHPGRKRPAQHH